MPDIKAVKKDEALSPEIKEITHRHSHIFQGIGKIRDNKSGQYFYAKFSMRPDAVPVAQKPRPVVYYLQEPLKKWLEQCLEEEIFEEVPEGEPVTWLAFTTGVPAKAKVQQTRQGRPGTTHDQSQRGPQGTQQIYGMTQDNPRHYCRRFHVQVP